MGSIGLTKVVPSMPAAVPGGVAWLTSRRTGTSRLLTLLDTVLTRDATRFWWIVTGSLFAVALLLRATAWMALPALPTPDCEEYCAVLHEIEAGRVPDVLKRNIGYPLYMFLCKQLPLPLHRSLPLIQHALALTAVALLMIWMRRLWGVLASLVTGALLLVNSMHCLACQYAQPEALMYGLILLATLAGVGYMLHNRRWCLAASAMLSMLVMVNREELMLLVFPAPLLVCFTGRAVGRRCRRWLVVTVAVMALCGGLRMAINYEATGTFRYSKHLVPVVSWRVFGEEEMVAPPRPPKLETLYRAALANGAKWRGNRLTYTALWRGARDQLGLEDREAERFIRACLIECLAQRPGTFLWAGLRDTVRFWIHPTASIEWEVFRLSDPAAYAQDAARFPTRLHRRAEFPATYEASSALSLFRRLGHLRPGTFFAIKPLAVCFLLGLLWLILGVGTRRVALRRLWFLGVALSVIMMSAFYATVVEPTDRYRIQFEWAFFAVASLGLVLPLHALRTRLPRATGSHE